MGQRFARRPSELLDTYHELTPIQALLLDARIGGRMAELEHETMEDLRKEAGAVGEIDGSLRSYIRRQRSRWAS